MAYHPYILSQFLRLLARWQFQFIALKFYRYFDNRRNGDPPFIFSAQWETMAKLISPLRMPYHVLYC